MKQVLYLAHDFCLFSRSNRECFSFLIDISKNSHQKAVTDKKTAGERDKMRLIATFSLCGLYNLYLGSVRELRRLIRRSFAKVHGVVEESFVSLRRGVDGTCEHLPYLITFSFCVAIKVLSFMA